MNLRQYLWQQRHSFVSNELYLKRLAKITAENSLNLLKS